MSKNIFNKGEIYVVDWLLHRRSLCNDDDRFNADLERDKEDREKDRESWGKA